MKRTYIIIKLLLCLGLFTVITGTVFPQSQQVLFKVMQDELERNMDRLVMEDLQGPYYISYMIDDCQQLEVKGSMGTLLNSRLDRSCYLTVDIRVGDYSLDNSSFVSGWSGMGPDYRQIAVDNDYDAIRNQIYLTTDRSYKNALKTLSKKKAYLQSRVIRNRPDDFIKLPANRFIDKVERFDIDQVAIEELIMTASAVLKHYPMIVSSELRVDVGIVNQYFVSSDGSKTLRGDRVYTIGLSFAGKNADGEDVLFDDRLVLKRFEDIPSKQDLTAWAKDNADKMTALVEADTIEEYIGPLILTEDAGGEFFRQLFAKHVSNNPPTVYDNERFAAMFPAPEFGNKINRRVLPVFFDVYSDPTIDKLEGLDLVGHYEVDDAGGIPQRVQLVEKGKLKSLLIGIAPTKKIKEPNGHARGAVSKDVTAKPSNLIFESSDQVSYDKLKQNLLKLCRDIDLEYGLVIKKIRDLNAPKSGGGYFYYGMPQRGDSELTQPLEVYKVYPDGREELVRGLEFANVTVRILRDILQTDDQRHVYNYLIANDYEMPVSVVYPSILVEEMELKKAEVKTQKPPVLPSPLADK